MLEQGARDVELVTSDWLVVVHQMKDVWKFAKQMSGEQFAMISGVHLMLPLFVDNLASQLLELLHVHEHSLELAQEISSWMMFSALELRLLSLTAKLAPPTTVYILRMLELPVLQLVRYILYVYIALLVRHSWREGKTVWQATLMYSVSLSFMRY